jgi:nucleotide-binding universal stress UspA family protein
LILVTTARTVALYRPRCSTVMPAAGRVQARSKGVMMYQRILIATDGSEFAGSAIAAGVTLAALARASIVVVHVRTPIAVLLYGEAAAMVPRETQLLMNERAKAAAHECLAKVEDAARRADVRCESVDVEDASAANGILETARAHDCDLIVMASHGRGALSRALLGSETTKVLAHATQAVLVTR